MKELDGRIFFWIPVVLSIIYGLHMFYLGLPEENQKGFLFAAILLFIIWEILVNCNNIIERKEININNAVMSVKFSILFWLTIIIIEINIWCKKRLTIKIK